MTLKIWAKKNRNFLQSITKKKRTLKIFFKNYSVRRLGSFSIGKIKKIEFGHFSKKRGEPAFLEL